MDEGCFITCFFCGFQRKNKDRFTYFYLLKWEKVVLISGCLFQGWLIKQKEDPNPKPYSLLDNDLGDTIKCFDVELAKDLKSKFNNKTQFIIHLEKYSLEFFNQVMQEIIT